jgi:hypothetical protein
MGTRIALVALVALTALAGCHTATSTEAPKAQVSSVPTPPPATVSINPGQGCTGPSSPPGGDQRATGKDLVSVAEDPTSLVANWFPSMNAGPRPDPAGGEGDGFTGSCRTERTTSGASVARRIAHDIDTAKAWPPGVYNCPADFNIAVDLYFRLPSGGWQVVRAELSGCRSVGAPGFRDREFVPPLSTDVLALAPPAWQGLNH